MSETAILKIVPEYNNLTRQDRKFVKTYVSLGLKRVPDVKAVTINDKYYRAAYQIKTPIVFEVPDKIPTYVIVGKFTPDERAQASNKEMLKQVLQEYQKNLDKNSDAVHETNKDDTDNLEAVPNEYDDDDDYGGFNKNDIELAMKNSNKSKKEVIAAFMRNNGDIVNAIMDLTS